MPETPAPVTAIEKDLPDLSATEGLAASLAPLARVGDVVALRGELGAGKTVFARAFIHARGGTEEVPSPTFTLVQVYELAEGPVYHFDLYRIADPGEVYELGIEEAFADGITLIEWPEHLGGLLPPERLDVALAMGADEDARRVTVHGHGDWAERLREVRIAAFLDAAGWGGADREALAGDASFRRYVRLTDGGRRAVLMDAPPPQEDVRPFARLARHLRGLGLSAPEIMAEDSEAGQLLLEDLGDDTYTRLLANGADEKALYALAVDVLVDLHRRPAALVIPQGLPPYDDTRLLDEACLFTDWYMPAIFGRPTASEVRDAFVEAWRGVFSTVHAQPRTLVLRDYHVDNLMRLRGRDGIAACGLLDFQDAVAGAAAYDLVSLLEDARRDITPDLTAAMLERYVSAFPEIDLVAFEAAYVILGAQRHAKVIGIFTRLCRRDGKAHYLVHIPRLWRLFERALEHPALDAVAQWVDRHVPRMSREIPPCQAAAQ